MKFWQKREGNRFWLIILYGNQQFANNPYMENIPKGGVAAPLGIFSFPLWFKKL